MSSSDSDDDFYGNIIKKRDKILSNYQAEENKAKQESAFDDSIILLDEIDDNIKDTDLLDLNLSERQKINKRKSGNKDKPNKRGRKSTKLPREESENSVISLIDITENTNNKRGRRGGNRRGKGSSRGRDTDVVLDTSKGQGTDRSVDSPRGRGTARGINTPRGRGTGRNIEAPRGRSRGRRTSRRRRTAPQTYDDTIPIYSIGNTDEYDDELEGIELFSSKQNNDDVILLDDSGMEENEELSVKVYWQSMDIHKFNIRKFQKLKEIFDFFSKKENVPIDKLLFTYDDIILKPDDTPDSIDYNIAKFIDGGILFNNTTSNLNSNKIKTSGLKIKFQYQKSKKPFEIYVDKDEKLSLAMTKCAEHIEMPLKKLKFEFDGDVISGSETLRDLDMEGEECIDVKLVR